MVQKVNKKKLSENDICDLYITPSIISAGYDREVHIRREVTLTPGTIEVFGDLARRNKKKRKRADYVIYKKDNLPIAIVEAKDNKAGVSDGMPQAIKYASILKVPSALSSNGDAFAYLNMSSNEELEKQISMENFPKPDELWKNYLKFKGLDNDNEEILEEYHKDKRKNPRYYQIIAINTLIEAILKKKKDFC